MGTFVNGGPDFALIARTMRPTTGLWHNATIRLVIPNIGKGEHNPWTNIVTGGEPTLIWQGRAGVQTLRSPEAISTGFMDTEVRGIRIQMPHDFIHQGVIHKGLEVYVVDGGEDESLRHHKFVVQSGIGSSRIWDRVIEAVVNLGTVMNAPTPLPLDYVPEPVAGGLTPDPDNPGYFIWEPGD